MAPARGRSAPARGRERDDDRGRDRDPPRGDPRERGRSRSDDRDDPPRGRSRDDDRGGRDRDRDDGRSSGRGGGRTSTSKFVYKPRSFDDVKERAEQTGGKFDSPIKPGFDIFRPKNGDNFIRYCPPSEVGAPYALSVWMHSYVGPDNSTYVCPLKNFNKPCPICAAAEEATRQGDRDEAKDLKPTEKRVAWILDRSQDDPTPMVFIMGWQQNRDIEALTVDKKKGKVVYIDDPDNGYDVRFTRSGTMLMTRYFGYVVERDESPLCENPDDQQKVIDHIMENPIMDILQVYDEDHLDRVINGATDSSSRDDVRDPPPRDRGGRDRDPDPAPRGRGRDRDPDQDKPIDDDRRGGRGRGSRDDPPDDDPPAGRRRSSRDDPPDDDPADDRGGRSRRGGRDDTPDDDPPRGRGRGGRDDPPDDDPPAGRRRSSRDDPPDDDPPPRRGGRDRDPPDDDPPARGGRRGRSDPDDEIPF
jgi:hypothetical protein